MPLVPAPVWEFSVGAETTVWTGHGYVALSTSGKLLSRDFNVFDWGSCLVSFVRRQSSRLVKFYTLESETNRVKIETEEIETVSTFCPWNHGFAKRNEIGFGQQFRIEIETKTMWNQGVQVFVSRWHEIETELWSSFYVNAYFSQIQVSISFWNSAMHQCGIFPMLLLLFVY